MNPKSGLILVDKPKGPSSQQVGLWVKDILKTKVCHVGTLDPFATGILPLLFGKAMKLQEYMQTHRKEYHAVLLFEKAVDEKELLAVLGEFMGKIYQKPPKRSAVSKKTRIRKIYYIDLLEIDGKHALVRMGCQHGTYVRKLADDIGMIMGEKVTLLELRRTKVEHFKDSQTVSLTRIRDLLELNRLDAVCIPLLEGVKHYPRIEIKEGAVKSILNGAPLAIAGVLSLGGDIKKGKAVAITRNGNLLAMGVAEMGRESSGMKKGIVAGISKVVVDKESFINDINSKIES